MKIYFTGSLHNLDSDKDVYLQIVKTVESFGYSVKADHILKTTKEELDKKTAPERTSFYKELNRFITASDVVVAEVSFPSTINIGHEVSLALDKGKPIIALYQPGREPGVLQGIHSDRFILLEYTLTDLKTVLEYGLEEAAAQIDIRFNFFVSPEIASYLDYVAKKRKLPRAVYLRRLIEEDMAKNSDYSG